MIKGNAFRLIKRYNQLLRLAEELEDTKAFDKAMSRKKKFVPLEEALQKVKLFKARSKSSTKP